jgi:hypothetical protein
MRRNSDAKTSVRKKKPPQGRDKRLSKRPSERSEKRSASSVRLNDFARMRRECV